MHTSKYTNRNRITCVYVWSIPFQSGIREALHRAALAEFGWHCPWKYLRWENKNKHSKTVGWFGLSNCGGSFSRSRINLGCRSSYRGQSIHHAAHIAAKSQSQNDNHHCRPSMEVNSQRWTPIHMVHTKGYKRPNSLSLGRNLTWGNPLPMAQQWRFEPLLAQFHEPHQKLSAARWSSALVLQLLLVLDLRGDSASLGSEKTASVHLGYECHRWVVFGKVFVIYIANPPILDSMDGEERRFPIYLCAVSTCDFRK